MPRYTLHRNVGDKTGVPKFTLVAEPGPRPEVLAALGDYRSPGCA